MNSMFTRFKIVSGVWKLSILAIILMASMGCSVAKKILPSDKDSSELFRARDQYVRIVPQDGPRGAAAATNEHPITLDAEQIRSALSTLHIMSPDSNKSRPVFNSKELDILGRNLSQGLAQATPDQDVAFAVISEQKGLYGLAKESRYTSARVFYREGKLNIIFGKIHGDYRANQDRRLYPLAPGSRTKASQHGWMLLEQQDQEFRKTSDGIRSDWIALDLASMEARAAMGEKQSEMGKDFQPGYKSQKTVEERLQLLEELKKKKLISDEEYQKKRANILGEL
jgi:hypothetical protein